MCKLLRSRLALLNGVLAGLHSDLASLAEQLYELMLAVSKVADAGIVTAASQVRYS